MFSRFFHLLAPALVFAAAAVGRANPPGAASMHTLIWSDEFNGTNAVGLDAAKWSWGQLPWGGNHHNSSYASTIVAGNSYIDGAGNLALGVRPGSFPATDGTTQPFSEGMIYSQGKFDYAYGYAEVSAKVSSATATWPAFWMLMNGWPPEIDVMEWFKSENNRMHTGLAWNNAGTVNWDDVNVYDPAPQDSWHTWALDWSPGRLAIYQDGGLRWGTGGDRVPTDPMYFILNSGVQSGKGASWWHDTLFDYVRVWKRNQYVYNGNFETWNGPWYREGNTSVNNGMGRGGSRGMRLQKSDTTANCYIDQPVYGLVPNTDYIFTGWEHTGPNYWPAIRIGAKNFGGAEVNMDSISPSFVQATLPFTTGATNTTANVFAWMPTTWGDTVVDDFNVRPAAAITDRGFESADLFYYWTTLTYGAASVVAGNARSGGYALRFAGAAHVASGAGQEIVGLKPNTAYRFSAWEKGAAANQPVLFGVKDYGGTETSVSLTASAWTRGSVNFTTGATNTSAVIYCYFPSTTGTSDAFVDDCFLYEPTAAPWTHGDVGAPAIGGAAGNRGATFIVQGTGADVWANADQFHFTYQTMPGDGTITAHVRNMENTSVFCKAGVMLRETLNTDSRHVFCEWLANAKAETIRRTATAGASSADQIASVTTAPWVRIRRDGNVFTSSYSVNGTTWIPIGSPQTISGLPVTLYAGLAVNSHDATLTNEATFDSVTVVPDDSDQDGMLDTWEMANFGNLAQTANGDADGDGMTNLQEFLAGTNPKDAASRLTATLSRPIPADPFTLTWPSVPGKNYTLLYQTTLGGAWQTLTTVPAAVSPATSTSYSDATSAGVGQRFYKVQVGP